MAHVLKESVRGGICTPCPENQSAQISSWIIVANGLGFISLS